MAPPPPTAPLFGLPLSDSCEFPFPPALHGVLSPEKHTLSPNSAVTTSSKVLGESPRQDVSVSTGARPPLAPVHSDLDVSSAPHANSLLPYTLLPPLSWVIKPLTVRVPSPPLLPCTRPSPTRAPAHVVVPASPPPSSHLAARHHPPLVRHLLDSSVPPPSFVDLPQFLSNAAFAAEGPATPAAARRRLSAPAAAQHHRPSFPHATDALAGLFTGAHNVNKASRPDAAKDASDGRCVTQSVPSQPSSAESDFTCSSGHVDMQKASNGKQNPGGTSSTDVPTKGASPRNAVRAFKSSREATPLGPLLQQLLTPQVGSHCRVHAAPEDKQSVEQWWRPTVLIPPFFSSPAALQRSENTLQSELASTVLRCRAAELRQQRLLQIAAAVIHQAVRVHASRIADIIEIQGTAAATATRAAPPVAVPGVRLKRERRPGTGSKRASRLSSACNRESDKSETFSSRYYDWLCGSAELKSNSGDGGQLQCLPVVVAPAGADVADHRLAVHGLLRECVRRWHSTNTVDTTKAADDVSQRDSLFLRLAIIRPTHCSSVGSAMHAIYEQITQVPLSSSALASVEKSGAAIIGRSSPLQREAAVRNASSRTSSRNAGSNDRRPTLHFEGVSSVTRSVHAGSQGSYVGYDGGAAAAWGESTCVVRRSAQVSSAAADVSASLSAYIDATQHDELEVATELQQLNGRNARGAEGGASDVGSLRMQEEFWEIENETAAVAALVSCDAEQSTCGAAGTSSSRHGFHQGEMKEQHYLRQVHGVDQQQFMQQQKQQQHRDYDDQQQRQSVECYNHLPFPRLSPSKLYGTGRSYARRTRESGNVCEKLACWWATQQQLLLQRNRERYNGRGAAAAPAPSPSRRTARRQPRGGKCASWGVRTRAATTHLLDSTAAQGNFPAAPSEEDSSEEEEESKGQQERTSEGSAEEEEEKGKKREQDAVEEANTTDTESHNEVDLQNNDRQVPRGIRGKTPAAATAALRLCNDNSRSKIMQPAAVVIVLEEAEAFPGGLLVRLLQLLALLRQQLSLPFIIVATASTNATVLQQLCDVPLSGGCCLTVEPATLLQPARVQQQLLQLLLCCPAALPFALPLAAAEKLLQSIEETSPSVLQLLRRLQLLLRLFYQHHPLAFLCRDLDGVAALMRFQNDGCVLTPAVNMQQQQQQQRSSSNSTATHARATGSSSERPCPRKTDGVHTTAKEEAIQEEKSNSSSPQEQQFLQQHVLNNNSRDISKPTRDFAAGGTSVASTAATNLKHDSSRELHAERVVKQLRRRVELLSFTSLTEDHVHMLRQLLRHTNEVFIHLTAAQQEGLLFFDRCCWEQVQLQRQHQRRMLLAAAATSSNGAAPPRSSNLLPPLQRDAAASTLALRCRPEEESENREPQEQQFSSSNEQGRAAAPGGSTGAGARSPLPGTVGLVASVTEDHVRRKTHSGCRRLAGCVARRSTLGLLKSWWGGRGLLLLHKVEEEEKQQKLLQQQEQGEQGRLLPSGSTSSGLGERQLPTGGEDTQGDLMPLKLKLLCKEVLPAASVELLQRRVGCCMGYRLLFVLQQQLQRCRRLASATATDVEAASATAGNCSEKFIGGLDAGRPAGNVELRAGENEHQQEEIDAAEEEEALLRIAAEGEANSNCRQTIETLDLLVGAHEEFSCLLRKCKPHTRVQEMAKACFVVEQDVRRVVVSLFEQFAVAAPVRVSAAAAAAQPPEVLADPAALVLPLKLFRAQVRREARLLRLLAAAEEAQQRREHQLTCGFDAANSVDAAAAAAHAPPTGKAYEVQQQQVPWYSDLPTHSFEVVRILDALDALICELSKAASPAVSAFPDAACVGVAPAGWAAPRRVGERTLTEAGTPETALSDAVANTQQREEDVAQNNLYSSRKRVQDTEAAAGQHRLARSSPQGTTLATSTAVAHQKRRQTEPAVGTLRALVSLKRKFLRWVEEALLLLLLPLPGWHPLGGELAVWGGALGFEVVAAAVQSAPGAAAQPPAASDCPPVLQSSAGNARSAAHKRCTAGTPSGTLAAAAELVCGSFEAAPQTETLQHAAMGSTSFLQRFNVPLEEEGKEGEEEEACVFQAQPQQRKQQRQQPLQHPSKGQEETPAESRTETGRETGEVKGAGKRIGEAGRHEEEVKLEDVAIVLRLVNSAGRRINMWDLFCAFCRDLLRDRLKKKRIEIEKKRQTGTYEGKEGRLQCSRPENISGTSCSPYPNRCGDSPQPSSGSGSVTKKSLSQRQKRRYTRVSESDVEEEVLRLMEAESCSLHADSTAVCNNSKCLTKNSGPTAGPLQSRECQHAKCLTAENNRRQKAASSRITQADVPTVGCTSHISRSPVGTRRDTPLSRIVDAAASPTADAFTAVEASLASGAVFAADDPSAVPVQLPGSAPGDRVPWTLLQQLQLRFAVAVETLDHQLGVIRLPSAASAAAAVERVMLDEDEGEDAAVHPDFSVVPPAGEQTASGDKVSPQEVDEIDVHEEDASEAEEEAEQEEFPGARDAKGGTQEQKQRSVESCKAGGTQKQGENTEQPERRYSRALRSTRSSRRGLAACERGRSAVLSSEDQQEDAEQIGVPLVPDDMLTHELRTMRKLLRNVFARRTHFVPVSINPAEESGDDTVGSSGNNVERLSDEEVEGRSVRKKSCSSRRKPHRRTRKKILL